MMTGKTMTPKPTSTARCNHQNSKGLFTIRRGTMHDLPHLAEIEISANSRYVTDAPYLSKVMNFEGSYYAPRDLEQAVKAGLLWVATAHTATSHGSAAAVAIFGYIITRPVTEWHQNQTSMSQASCVTQVQEEQEVSRVTTGSANTTTTTEDVNTHQNEKQAVPISYLYVDGLYVHRSYQGRGVGTALLEHVETYAREATTPEGQIGFDYLSVVTYCGDLCPWNEPFYPGGGFVTVPREDLLDPDGNCSMPAHRDNVGTFCDWWEASFLEYRPGGGELCVMLKKLD